MKRAELRAWTALIGGCGLGWALLLAFLAGPTVEAALFPVRRDQRIEHVERIEDRLCWDWVSTKVRNLVAPDVDVTLIVGDKRFAWYVYQRRSGQPWGASNAVGLGPRVQLYCSTLPPHVLPTDAVRIEWVASFPGLFGTGAYRLSSVMPDVVDPGMAVP